MTKRDFVAMAETIRSLNMEIDAEASKPMASIHETAPARAVLFRMACALSDQYKRDNARFDRGRFASACGFPEREERALSAR